MLGALLYLRFTSFRNWLGTRARRLREPKYAFGAVVGCAYFYFFFFHALGGSGRPRPTVPAMDAAGAALPMAAAAGALLLFGGMAAMWIVPTRRAALGFSEAEIAFLFPAPVTRRALVHFRLLSAQFRSLAGAMVMMLFSNRWGFLGGNALTHAIGWWFVFSTLSLHFNGAAFTLTRLADRGLGAWRRRVLVLAALLLVLAATVAGLPADDRVPGAGPELSLRPLADWIVTLADTRPLGWVLWPCRILLAPFLAATWADFLAALGPALLIVTAHYLWVVRTASGFEEASFDYAQKRGARIAAWRSGSRGVDDLPTAGRVEPFRLPGAGRPEVAFLWKNLLSTWPYFTLRVFAAAVVLVVAGCWWLASQPASRGLLPGLGAGALLCGAYTLVIGPQFARQDLRGDLLHADTLKTYPLAGWQIVLGELLTPAAILTGLLWLAVLIAALAFAAGPPTLPWLTPPVLVVGSLALAVTTPLLVSLQLLVPTAAALLFPGWYQAGRTRGGGPEVLGQRMIFFFAQTLTMVLALIPAALVAALPLMAAALLQITGPAFLLAAGVAGALLMLVVLAAEVGGGVWLLGRQFERLDLTNGPQP